MAIYHMSVKPVSRSQGRSSTAAAAYRAADVVEDARTGERHDYTRRSGVVSAAVVMPAGAEWAPSRSELWSAAELAEKRKDGCVAREHEVALPAELSRDEQLELVKQYAQELADRHGCAVDYAIHEPNKAGDEKNDHAHILCSTRRVEQLGLGAKCDREKAGRNRQADLTDERRRWERHVNAALAKHGHAARVDHRSLKDQGIERAPGKHRGPVVTEMLRRGAVSTVAVAQDRERRELQKLGHDVADLRRQIEALEVAERAERKPTAPPAGPAPTSSTPAQKAAETRAPLPPGQAWQQYSDLKKMIAEREARADGQAVGRMRKLALEENRMKSEQAGARVRKLQNSLGRQKNWAAKVLDFLNIGPEARKREALHAAIRQHQQLQRRADRIENAQGIDLLKVAGKHEEAARQQIRKELHELKERLDDLRPAAEADRPAQSDSVRPGPTPTTDPDQPRRRKFR